MKKLYGIISIVLLCTILFSGCSGNKVTPGEDAGTSDSVRESESTPFETDIPDGTDKVGAGGVQFPDIDGAPEHSLIDFKELLGDGENNLYELDFIDAGYQNVKLCGNLLLCVDVNYSEDIEESRCTYLHLYDIATKTAFPEFRIDGIYDCGFTGKGNIYLVQLDWYMDSEIQKIYLYDISFEQLYTYRINKSKSEQYSVLFSYDEKYLVYTMSGGPVYIVDAVFGDVQTAECELLMVSPLCVTEKYVYFSTMGSDPSYQYDVRVNPETAEVDLIDAENNLALRGHGIRAALTSNLLYALNDDDKSVVDIMPANGAGNITDYNAGCFACTDYNFKCYIFNMKSGVMYSGTADFYIGFVYISENGYAVIRSFTDDGSRFYIWDYLSEVPQSVEVINSTADYGIEDMTREIAERVSENRNVDIFYGSEGNDFDCGDYVSKCASDKYTVYTAVRTLSRFLDDIPHSMISTLSFGEGQTLKIRFYLCGGLYGIGTGGLGTAGGVTFRDSDGNMCVAVDIGQNDLMKTFAHEFSHVIDYRLTYLSENKTDVLSAWEKLNPAGFEYAGTYGGYADGDINEKYTATGNLSDDTIYFVDSYSKTFPTEDRARIFEYLFTYSEDDAETPIRGEHMLKKARYYCAMLRFAFPQIEEEGGTLIWETLAGEPDMNEFADIFNSTVAPVTDNTPKG